MRFFKLPTERLAVLGILMASASIVGCDRATSVASPVVGAVALARSTDNLEHAYFDGRVVTWQFPSGSSSDQNELVLGCFRAGPDFNTHANGPRGRLYAVFLEGANQHSCPDGTDVHDHILSAIPGSPNYSTQWELLEVWPGPSFDPGIMPITSEAALLAAEKLGQVVIIDDEIVLHAVVVSDGQ
jgi:hypothetical protein